ncbi:peptidoglycan-binding domain-containing protein [Arthrobacter sp. SIMBA_036]|uniref:peptidoglycan-binding domain-containing protein n=1 Tax=Arthrobacter sp. SIMBA_036 TaxID=3085778 RepID=UPI00397A057E
MSTHSTDAPSHETTELPLRARRILHPLRIWAFLLTGLVLLGAAFWAGTLVKAPNDVALDNAQKSVPVTFPLSMKVVDRQLALKGTVVRGQTTAISPPVTPGAARQVVTKPGPAPGTEVAPGSFLGSVGGRPVFLLPDDVPVYRDLDVGDSGDDVVQLQKALQGMGFSAVTVTGKFDAASRDAVKRIYSGDGLTAPDKPIFRAQEFAQIPGNRGVVASSAGLATLVTGTVPLLVIQTTPDVVTARATVVDADSLTAGGTVRLSVGDQSIESTVLSVGAFTDKAGASGEGPGKDVTISVPPEGSAWLVPDKLVNVQGTTDPQPRLAVPLIAIQHDGAGSFIDVEQPASSTGTRSTSSPSTPSQAPSFQRVDVTVTTQSSGWAAVESSIPLSVGQQVRVP